MLTLKKVLLPILVMQTIPLTIKMTHAVCCQPEGRNVITGNAGTCDDGTLGDICCGVGDCNVFCCNCDGGCIMGNPVSPQIVAGGGRGTSPLVMNRKRKRREVAAPNKNKTVEIEDRFGFNPYNNYGGQGRRGTYYPARDGFLTMDLNRDKQVSYQEACVAMISGRIINPSLMMWMTREFNRMDYNQDGYLSRIEIGGMMGQ